MKLKTMKLGIDLLNLTAFIFAVMGIVNNNWKLSVSMLLAFVILGNISLVVQLMIKPIVSPVDAEAPIKLK